MTVSYLRYFESSQVFSLKSSHSTLWHLELFDSTSITIFCCMLPYTGPLFISVMCQSPLSVFYLVFSASSSSWSTALLVYMG